MIEYKKDIIDLINKSDKEIYLDMMNKDISSHKLSNEIKLDIIEKSINEAQNFYDDLIKEYGLKDVLSYIIDLNIPLYYVKEKGDKYYSYVGLFKEKTKTIIVNLETINYIKKVGKLLELSELVDLKIIRKVVISHELFHYFELKNPNAYTNKKIIDTKVFGLFKTKSNLMIAGEIAAVHFSKILTNLKHTPLVYNMIFKIGKKMNINGNS